MLSIYLYFLYLYIGNSRGRSIERKRYTPNIYILYERSTNYNWLSQVSAFSFFERFAVIPIAASLWCIQISI